MSEEKSRTINVKTKNQDEVIKLKFDTTHQYTKAYETLLNKAPSEDRKQLSLDNLSYKFDIDADSILFFYNPEESIKWADDAMMELTIIFVDKQKISLLIAGNKRARNAYNVVKILLEKQPTNFFINLPQDDFKFALIKHYDQIKEIYLNKFEKIKSING